MKFKLRRSGIFITHHPPGFYFHKRGNNSSLSPRLVVLALPYEWPLVNRIS